MKDGTYQSIFKKWGLPQEAMISNPKINGAIS
jgi:ABC-type amino acid transport substrate-binding protein